MSARRGRGEPFLSPFAPLFETRGSAEGESQDERFLRLALEEAWRGVGRTHPNPPVGAVVVQGGRVVGRGHHERAGEPHAEVNALERAGRRARGGTLYVTLEPCCHHGRTPPCTERVLEAGVARVVVGARDPNPLVSGRGMRRLRSAGVEVRLLSRTEVGRAARALIAPFESAMVRRRPWVIAKVAASLDGRVATRTGDARWISSEASRRLVHALRDRVDAVCVGSGTVLVDDPALTVRHLPRGASQAAKNPLRVVLDGRLRTRPTHRVYQRQPRDPRGRSPALVVHLEGADATRRRAFDAAGVPRVEVSARGGRIPLDEVMERLCGLGITSVLVEPGATLFASLLAAGLVDEVWWFAAPLLIGGDGIPAIAPPGAERLSKAVYLDVAARVALGGDTLIVATSAA